MGSSGQSPGHEHESSPRFAWHWPLPQHWPQSPGQVWQFSVPLHWASPHTAATAQVPQASEVTSAAQMESQDTSQQNESCAHTQASTVSPSQPGFACALQQSPLHEPHWSASLAQMLSQLLVQQKGSRAQTHLVTAGSLHPFWS